MKDETRIRNAAGRKVLADPRTHRYYPVSYTHLDVYKRQTSLLTIARSHRLLLTKQQV